MDADTYRFFHRATLAICRHLAPERALQACAQLLAEHMPVGRLYLECFDADSSVVRSLATATVEAGETLDLVVPMPPALREQLVSFRDQPPEHNVFIVNDPSQDPLSATMLRSLGAPLATSVLGTYPLLDRRPLGAVVVTAPGIGRYDDSHARLFTLLKDPFAIAIHNALQYRELQRLQELLADDNRYLRETLQGSADEAIIGADAGLADAMRAVNQVAVHDSPVLLLGETGVGKDLIADHIHRASPRATGPLVRVNCGAIPDSLMDSELFGHEKGAFTGALSRKRGRFERADGGTIFLDEIGELTPQAQTRLLRVLQNREIERVGSDQTLSVDIRVVAATHRDLAAMVRSGDFREDLWFRLAVFPLTIPPLRARREDISALATHFVAAKARQLKLPATPPLAPGALRQLQDYSWPGNVRELENVIERALITSAGKPLTFQHLTTDGSHPEASLPSSPPAAPERSGDASIGQLNDIIAAHIRRALTASGGKVHGPGGAAEMLGINPGTLRYRMDKLGIAYGRQRQSSPRHQPPR